MRFVAESASRRQAIISISSRAEFLSISSKKI